MSCSLSPVTAFRRLSAAKRRPLEPREVLLVALRHHEIARACQFLMLLGQQKHPNYFLSLPWMDDVLETIE